MQETIGMSKQPLSAASESECHGVRLFTFMFLKLMDRFQILILNGPI